MKRRYRTPRKLGALFRTLLISISVLVGAGGTYVHLSNPKIIAHKVHVHAQEAIDLYKILNHEERSLSKKELVKGEQLLKGLQSSGVIRLEGVDYNTAIKEFQAAIIIYEFDELLLTIKKEIGNPDVRKTVEMFGTAARYYRQAANLVGELDEARKEFDATLRAFLDAQTVRFQHANLSQRGAISEWAISAIYQMLKDNWGDIRGYDEYEKLSEEIQKVRT
ncbi:hypothetical protein GOV04_00390 [Candidatus Woesearchaeota archaeon]|nr:hypothetical protein [Candidatus Woesearchaeota archaeon]